ncbi:MAG TPA: nucleotide exchange factor GrpE [Clostridia bacterium]|nr:nucleotide exchange factor GrpE [Clostridia bacterium]
MTTRKHPHDPQEGERSQDTAEPVTARPVAALEAKIAELESAAAEAKDRHLRLAADFDNYKRRSRQEQLETIQHASAELISRLLPGLDDLHKALDHKPKGIDEAWLKGMELSVRKLEEALHAHGLEAIEAVGKPFDPNFHEAIGHEDSTEHPEDTVVQVLRPGYRIRDRVVRPALVKVARRPARPAPDDGAGSDESR